MHLVLHVYIRRLTRSMTAVAIARLLSSWPAFGWAGRVDCGCNRIPMGPGLHRPHMAAQNRYFGRRNDGYVRTVSIGEWDEGWSSPRKPLALYLSAEAKTNNAICNATKSFVINMRWTWSMKEKRIRKLCEDFGESLTRRRGRTSSSSPFAQALHRQRWLRWQALLVPWLGQYQGRKP